MEIFIAILLIIGFAILLFSNETKVISESDKKKAEAYCVESVKYLHSGQYSQALDLSNRALKMNPKMIEAWNIKASALQRLGKIQEAISSYLKGLKLNPNDEVIKENLLGLLFTNVFNNTRQGELLFNSLSYQEQKLIEELTGN